MASRLRAGRAAGAQGPAPSQGDASRADLVVKSSCVFTGLSDEPCPAAVAIRGDRIVWVGCEEDLPRHVTCDDAVVHDFGDMLVMPGFHDSHLHFFHSALYSSPLAERFCGTSERDAVARLAPLAARRPAGSWLLAQGWRDYLWTPAGTPSKRSLDEAYPDRPVAMYSGDAHTLWVNSAALERLGFDDASSPPAGGSYDRDGEGRLTGVIREAAAMELMPRIVGEFSEGELLEAYRSFARNLNEHGVTAVCDMSLMAHPGLDFVRDDLFRLLEERDELTVRVHLFPTLLTEGERLSDMRRACAGPLVRACGYKQFFDGVSSQHTAWLRDAYENARFDGDCGRPTVDPAVMEELVARAAATGDPVRIHAIGDAAIHRALDIFERTARRAVSPVGGDLRPGGAAVASDQLLCLEHLENFQPDDIVRLARLGVVAAVQPRHITLDPGGPERDLGYDRALFMWPFRSLIDAGACLAFGTDSPVTDIDPLASVYTAVTRRDADTREPKGGWLPSERITLAEALRAYTRGSAQAAGREDELGVLAPGMLADVTVIDRDLFADVVARPEAILDARVMATFVGGTLAFMR